MLSRRGGFRASVDFMVPLFDPLPPGEQKPGFVGLPAGPVFDINQMHADPHAIAREMVIDVPHKTLGTAKALGMPVKFSGTPQKTDQGAPVYGQHTREVLAEHGFGADEIQALIDAGAVISDE